LFLNRVNVRRESKWAEIGVGRAWRSWNITYSGKPSGIVRREVWVIQIQPRSMLEREDIKFLWPPIKILPQLGSKPPTRSMSER
jgi:hypothetical protein